MKKGRGVILIVCLSMSLCIVSAFQPSSVVGKTIKLKFATYSPNVGFLPGQTAWFLQEIEKRSQGKVKIMPFWGTLAKVKQVHYMVEQGGVDMGMGITAYYKEMFPYFCAQFYSMYCLPGKYQPLSAINAYRELARQAPEIMEEWKRHNQMPVSYIQALPSELISTKPVRNLKDLKGLKLRAVGTALSLYKAAGGVTVSIPSVECYEAMGKKVLEAVDMTPEGLLRYKLHEAAKNLTVDIAGYGGLLGYAYTVNLDSWNRLPRDIQDIIIEVGKDHEKRLSANMAQEAARTREQFIKSGVQVFKFPPSDREKLLNKTALPTYDKYIKAMEKKGYSNARTILDKLCKLLGYDPYRYK